MLRLRRPRGGRWKASLASAVLLMVFVAGGAFGAIWARNFADTSVSVAHSGGVSWANDDLGPVNTLVIGSGTCTWSPQGLGTNFKTATVSFTDTWGDSQCVIGRQVGGMGELFIMNMDAHHPITVTGFDFGSSGNFCAAGGGCPIEVTLLAGLTESAPPLTFPFNMAVGQADNIQLVLTVNAAVANADASYHDLRLGFLAHQAPPGPGFTPTPGPGFTP